MYPTPAIQALYQQGAHYALCNPDNLPHTDKLAKRITGKQWNKTRPTLAKAFNWVDQHPNRLLAIIPASINCLVIDLDPPKNDQSYTITEKELCDQLDQLDITYLVINSNRGKHFYLKTNASVQPRHGQGIRWENIDIRHSHDGCIILWHISAVCEFVNSDTPPVSEHQLASLLGATQHKTKCTPNGQDFIDKFMASKGAERVQLVQQHGYTPGKRQEQLNTDAYYAKKEGRDPYIFAQVASAVSDPNSHDIIHKTIERAIKDATKTNNMVFDRITPHNLMQALILIHTDVRYNIRNQKTQFLINNIWENANKLIKSKIRHQLADTFQLQLKETTKPFYMGVDKFDDVLDAVLYSRQIDPIKQWFDNLPEWDKQLRIDNLFTDIWGVEPNPLHWWASRYAFIAAIQRTYEPGCALNEFPVLVGSQQIGKSLFVKSLIPAEYQAEWHLAQFNLADSDLTKLHRSLGKLIIEVSEMAGSTRAERNILKAYLTTSVDEGRLSYRKDSETFPRRFIFIGTTNSTQSLPSDETGNRRFVPIELPPNQGVQQILSLNLPQLWAEAKYRYQYENVRANLPHELENDAIKKQKQHTYKPVLVEIIKSMDWQPKNYKLVDILTKVQNETQQKVILRQLTHALKLTGWEHKRNKQGAFWVKKV